MTQLGNAIRATPAVLGYWPMGADSGNEVDVVNGWDAVPQTPAAIARAQAPIVPNGEGKCVVLGGVAGGYFDVADRDELDFPGTAPYTFECWARNDDPNTANPHYLLSKRSSTNNGFIPIYVPANQPVQVYRYDGTTFGPLATSANGTLAPGLVRHIVVTYDGATITVYVDGVVAATRANVTVVTTTTSPFRIGGFAGGTTVSWLGAIQEVAAYNVAIDAARAWQHYRVGVGEELAPGWTAHARFIVPAGVDGVIAHGHKGASIDLSDAAARGGIVSADPYLVERLRSMGLQEA